MINSKRKKLGLALGSGGARGMALLGALKALEEENIEFDVVAGTSIGSVIGALYAKGYTVGDMLRLKESLGVSDPQNILLFYLGGTGLVGIMRRVTGGAYFDDLVKPFRAIATDLLSGEEVVIGAGDVSTAIAASSAIPPAFRPVVRDGRRLVDGAYVNSVPSDAVKSLGADKILGIDLGAETDTNFKIKRSLDELYPENGVKLGKKSEQGYKYSDYVLAPDLKNVSGADVMRLDEIYAAGYGEAKEKMNEIKAALQID